MVQKLKRPRGETRQIVTEYLATVPDASISQITAEVERRVGPIPPSSIRSHLNANTPGLYERVGLGRYRLGHPKRGGV